MSKEPVFCDALPPAAGPFVPAVRHDGTLYVSGQIGQDPATGKLVDGGVEAEARQALTNFANLLAAAGGDVTDVIRACIYLTDMGDFAAVNAIYGEVMREPFPARTCIAVAALPMGARFEIDAIVQA